MKLRLPKALIAAVTTPLVLGMVMATQAKAEYAGDSTTVDLLPTLPDTLAGLKECWIDTKTGWSAYHAQGTNITETQMTGSLTGGYGFQEEGWHFSNNVSAHNQWANSSDLRLLTNGFSFNGRGASNGEFAIATAGVSSLFADSARPVSLSLSFTCESNVATHVYVWKWDGTTATKIGYQQVTSGTQSVTLRNLSLSDLSATDKLVFLWFANDGGNAHSITNMSTSVSAMTTETLTWTGTTQDWSKSGVSNWQGESGATTAIGAMDTVVFGSTDGNKAVNVTEDITVKGMTVSDTGYTFSGDGAITITNALTVENTSATIGTNLTLGAATVTMTGADSALTVTGDVTLQGTVTNDGGQLDLQGGFGVATDGLFTESFGDEVSCSTVNGFVSKQLVQNTNGGTVSATVPAEVNIGGGNYTVKSTDSGITAYGSEYHVNDGKVVYGGTGAEANSAASATGITLAGGELEMKQALAQGVITATGNATLTIDEGVSVSNTQINHTGGTLLLNGDGEFDYGANKAFSNNFKLGGGWTGTVVVSGITDGSGGLNLLGNDTSLGNADSTVKLNGAKVWLALQDTNTNMNTNLELEDAGSTSALNVSAVSSRQYNFNKTIKGSGTMEVSSSTGMGDNIDGAPGGFNFIGNIEGWDGTILDSAASGTKYFRIADGAVKDGGTLAVNLKNTGAGTANFYIDQSDATIIDSNVTRTAGTLNLTLSNTGKKTLNGTIDATSVTITGGEVELGATASISAKNAAGESGKGVTLVTKPAGRTFGLVPSGDGEGEPAEGGATVTPGATIQHATVSANSITKETGYTGHGSIGNALVTVDGGTNADAFSITHMDFTNSVVDLAEGAFVSMNDVVIGAGSAVVNESGTYTASNVGVVLTADNVSSDAVSFEDGTVTLTTNVLGTNADLSGNFDLTLTDGFLKALQLEVIPEHSGTLIIDFGSTVSLAAITPGTLNVTEYADVVTFAKAPANSEGAITGVVITFEDNNKAIPEPATATLSLLALAGLAARRRRRK